MAVIEKFLDKMEEMYLKIQSRKEEKFDLMMELHDFPESIKEKVAENPKNIKKYLEMNGKCLYYLDEKHRNNPDLQVAAARTNPEWLDVMNPEDLYKNGRWLKVVLGMRSRANEIKKFALELNPDISHSELKDLVGSYVKTVRKSLKIKLIQFKKIQEEKSIAQAIAREERSAKRRLSTAKNEIERAEQRFERDSKRIQSMKEKKDKLAQQNVQTREGVKAKRKETDELISSGEIDDFETEIDTMLNEI